MPESSRNKIGFTSATALIVGSIIGAGIFMKPAAMAAQLSSPLWLTGVWILAGLLSLFGALIFAELGAMMPETGGLYVYFRKIFGPFTGYLYGWACLSVINTAAIAAVAYVAAWYTGYFVDLPAFPESVWKAWSWHLPGIGRLYPLQEAGVKGLAIVIILFFTGLNVRSLRAGDRFQVVSTGLKIFVFLLLVVGIFSSGKGHLQHFVTGTDSVSGTSLLAGIMAALTGAFFTYDGWVNITSMAGDVERPQRNIPRSLFWGVLICMLVYVLVNQAYLYVLPVEKMAASRLVAADAMAIALGHTAEGLVAAAIILCTLGAVNGNIMATTRITYAMGRDRVFAAWTGREHPRYATPAGALWLHGLWTCLLVVSGSFDMLADMFVFVTWCAYGLGAVGIFMLRYREPRLERPYRIWMHPYITVLFIAFTGFYLVSTIYHDMTAYFSGKQPVINSLLGLLITMAGVPFYLYYRKKYKSKSAE
jgi:APA family basic amino acid/polyamine antiporter